MKGDAVVRSRPIATTKGMPTCTGGYITDCAPGIATLRQGIIDTSQNTLSLKLPAVLSLWRLVQRKIYIRLWYKLPE